VNFFEVRAAIVDMLKGALPAGTHVLTADELDGIGEASQPVPAVHVIYSGFRVVETPPSGKSAVIDQDWLVVAVIKHAGDRAKAAREAGERVEPLVNGVLGALMGWRHAATGMRPLALTTPPEPQQRWPFYYFPLTFSARVALQKTT
jgi:hypothetical protein